MAGLGPGLQLSLGALGLSSPLSGLSRALVNARRQGSWRSTWYARLGLCLCLCLASWLVCPGLATADDWKLIHDEDGIKVFRSRKTNDDRLLTVAERVAFGPAAFG